ncbi:MAG: ParB/RepB/Spo0J family partition protein [Clostridia bacterium]|nr:ParB/RepB/Spo0J family partition protein [Clostridia bacterium]
MFDRERSVKNVVLVSAGEIRTNPRQPRRKFSEEGIVTLADSISRHGLIQPISVRYLGKRAGYELIAGERRLRACRLLGMEKVPCIVFENVDELKSAELAMIENLHREQLGVFEEAAAIEELMKRSGMNQAEAAKALSLSRCAVSNKLRLLALSPQQRNAVVEGGLGERHARAVLSIPDDAGRTLILEYAAKEGLSAKKTEDLVTEYLSDPEGVRARLTAPPKTPKQEKEPESEQETKPKPIRKFFVKDVRIFINSVDKALRMVKECGIDVSADRREDENGIEYMIRVPKITA